MPFFGPGLPLLCVCCWVRLLRQSIRNSYLRQCRIYVPDGTAEASPSKNRRTQASLLPRTWKTAGGDKEGLMKGQRKGSKQWQMLQDLTLMNLEAA